MQTGWKERSKGMDSEIDAKMFWEALGCRAIGVAIVTARGTAGPAGFLALSATHLSPSPPMMMVSISYTTSALGAVRQGNHFAINYLAKGSDDLIKEFGGGGAHKDADRFKPGTWAELKTGAPALVDAVGVIDCRLEEMIERHGAVIALGRVVAYTALAKEPMISFRGGYL
jgi:flavin reductase (DIM6/NTAB) family NADH-FMN oxidoreductase RutF